MSRTTCPHCQTNFRNYTPKEFVLDFKIGDIVSAWATCKTVEITAIGRARFLAWEEGRDRETVCTMKANWRKIENE